MMAFLARLEHELHCACQFVAPRAQHLGGSHQHRDMGVMATGVHRTVGGRAIVQPGIFMERQGVHIAPQ